MEKKSVKNVGVIVSRFKNISDEKVPSKFKNSDDLSIFRGLNLDGILPIVEHEDKSSVSGILAAHLTDRTRTTLQTGKTS